MSGDTHDDDELRAARRDFLLKCGRFAVVTPPVVSLMLTVSDKASAQGLATSPGKEKKKTTTTKTTTNGTTTNGTITRTVLPTDAPTGANLIQPDSAPETRLAMMMDSMGVMKIG